VQIDLRWGAGDVDRVRVYAAELVSLRPDVIFANGVTSVGALQRETNSLAHFGFTLLDKRTEFVKLKTGFREICFEKLFDGLLTGPFFSLCGKTSAAESRKFVARIHKFG
jgi:hypothetical protein